MSIYSNSVKKPITTLMIFIGIIVLGIFSLVQLPIDLYPKMDPPFLSVMTSYPGANAEDIEENVTKILEDRLNSIENLKKMSSKSQDNLSVVTLEFEWGTNLDEASNQVRDAIDKSMRFLPNNLERPTLLKFNTSMIPIVMYGITADVSYPGIDRIIEDKVINRLNRIEGVASATIAGTPQRTIYIDLNPHLMDAYNISIEEISAVVSRENMNLPSGNIKVGASNYQLRVEGEFDDSRQFGEIVLTSPNGRQIKLNEISVIKDTIKDISLEQLIDKQQGAVLFISKQSGANSVAIAKNVKAEVEKILPDLPEDVHMDILMDTSDFIVKSIRNLSETLIYALIFVVLVVLFFLGRWRATFIIALTIPVSLIAAFIYLYVTGSSLNIISLTSLSIAIGMVVDDAIVVLENISKHTERGTSARDASIYGTNEVWLSVIATTLVVIAVFFPLTLMSGMTGILFKQLGWIVCITVSVSTLTAISLTPMLSSQLLKSKIIESDRPSFHKKHVLPILDRMDSAYGRFIRWALYHKTLVIMASICIFAISLMMSKLISTDFMPQNDEGNMSIYVKTQTGQRVEETKKVALRIDSIIRINYPEAQSINLAYGSEDENARTGGLFNKSGSNIINIRVKLRDIKERSRSVFEISEDLRPRIDSIPDVVNFTISTSSGGGGSMGGGNSLDIEIFGHSFEETNRIAMEIASSMRNRKGVRDVNISRDDDKPELQFIPNQEELSKHGLSTMEVANAVRNYIYGARPGKYKENGQEYSIVIRIDEEYRNSFSEILNLAIFKKDGKKIKLRELGEIRELWTPPNIDRENKQRVVKVNIKPAPGTSLGDLAHISQEVIDKMKDIPQEVSVYVGGDYTEQQKSFGSITSLMLLSLLLVYIVMASQFESFKMPLIIMASIPFAFSGVVLALLITRTTLSIVAALGAVMLIGIVTKNAIVLIDFINLLRERGMHLYDAIAEAGRSRIRPVMMTAATTILGMLPMALSFGEGAETWRPMGVSIIGGLVFSTVITMLIVPVLYAAMDKSGSRDKKKKIHAAFRFMKDFDAKKELPVKTDDLGL